MNYWPQSRRQTGGVFLLSEANSREVERFAPVDKILSWLGNQSEDAVGDVDRDDL